MSDVRPVVMCGGAGSRLWPASRPDRPKPLLALVSGQTLLADTIARFTAGGYAPPWLVTGAAHDAAIGAEAPGALRIVEPVPRGTAAAIAVSVALAAADVRSDPLLLVTPADHAVGEPAALRAAIAAGVPAAEAGWIVTFGIEPTSAATGFGWIRPGAPTGAGEARRVAAFVEKPDEATAARLLAAGGHAWNSGMFLFAAGAVARALERLAPDLWAAATAAVGRAVRDGDRVLLDAEAFVGGPPVASFDRVVMERTDRAAVVAVDCGWSDVGTWEAVRALRAGASVGPVALDGSPGAFGWSDGPKIEVRGCPGVTVVASADGVWVAGAAPPRRFVVARPPGPAWLPGAPPEAQPGWPAHAAFARGFASRWPTQAGAPADGGLVWVVDAPSGPDALADALADDPWGASGVVGPPDVAALDPVTAE